MPYEIKKSGEGYKVFKKGTSKAFSKEPMSHKKAEAQLKALYANTNEGKTNTMKKSELREMIQEIIKEVISEQATNKITEAYVPDNIKSFAKRKGVSSLVNTVASWAENAGKRITGGTAIGKNYSTLILDMGYQTADIYIDTEEGTIELYGKPVRNFNEFKKVWLDQMTADEEGKVPKMSESVTHGKKIKLVISGDDVIKHHEKIIQILKVLDPSTTVAYYEKTGKVVGTFLNSQVKAVKLKLGDSNIKTINIETK
jgi:hypothetical protein